MAHCKKVWLTDDASNKFLESRGFYCAVHCGQQSYWMLGGACYLLIDVNKVVKDDLDIYQLIAQQYYTQGREQGKQDALETIRQRIGEWIFPRPAVVTEAVVVTEPVVGGLYGNSGARWD
jgi:hypothetical protein